MTLDQIAAQMENLKQKKKDELIRIRRAKAKAKRQEAMRKRKVEDRVKYIVGGYVLSHNSGILTDMIQSGELRQQDIDTINNYLSL